MRARLLAISLLAVTAAALAADLQLPDALREYSSWHAATTEPVPVPLAAWYLCRPAMPAETDAAEKEFGDHANHLIRVFVNETGAARFADRSAALPPGSVVVKEKLDGGKIAAVAAMIKHAPGYSESTGDWEFVFYGHSSRPSGGAALQAHCGGCHATSKSRDWLFRNYLDDTPAP